MLTMVSARISRTVVTGLVMATVGIGLFASAGAAHADGPSKTTAVVSGTPVAQPGHGTTVIQRQVISTGTTHVTPAGSTNVHVTAAPTGDGPADKAECDRWAGLIDIYNGFAVDGANHNSTAADGYLKLQQEAEDAAMDRGCFISYG
jgi:hypothetical protein